MKTESEIREKFEMLWRSSVDRGRRVNQRPSQLTPGISREGATIQSIRASRHFLAWVLEEKDVRPNHKEPVGFPIYLERPITYRGQARHGRSRRGAAGQGEPPAAEAGS